MGGLLTQLVQYLDVTVHPDSQKQGGMVLLRSRMLSLSCLLTLLGSGAFLGILILNRSLDLRLLPIYLILGQSILILILNRFLRVNIWLSATLLIFLSAMIGLGIIYQARSVYASAFLWFQVLIMPAFLLCGRRLGIVVAGIISLIALTTVKISQSHGSALPYDGVRVVGFQSMIAAVLIINLLTLGIVAIYFHLLRESQKSKLEQKTWLQRTGRMEELLQMSGHFALKTNGPLDVLGTALHNLEEPLKNQSDTRVLLSMLAPVESGIQDLAAVARSFSLFSRRYLEEGLEQTSFNTVLRHVDTIYNVGELKSTRFQWNLVDPDILLYTQTAKLVMLLITILRRIRADGGARISLQPTWDAAGLHLTFHYTLPSANERTTLASDADAPFDPELNEDLIQELCRELGVQCGPGRDEGGPLYRLDMPMASRPTKPA